MSAQSHDIEHGLGREQQHMLEKNEGLRSLSQQVGVARCSK